MTSNRITLLPICAGFAFVSIAACGSDVSSLFGNAGDVGSSGATTATTTTSGAGSGTGGATTGAAGSSNDTGGAAGSSDATTSAGSTGGAATTGGAGGDPTSSGAGGSGGKATGGAAGTSTGDAGGGAGATGTGGSGGSGGGVRDAGAGGGSVDAGDVCANLEAAYRTALTEAKVCNPRAPLQCALLVSTSVSCPGCSTHVQDQTQLQAITNKWLAAGCRRGICPAIACVNPGIGVCSESGGSGGRCVDSTVLR